MPYSSLHAQNPAQVPDPQKLNVFWITESKFKRILTGFNHWSKSIKAHFNGPNILGIKILNYKIQIWGINTFFFLEAKKTKITSPILINVTATQKKSQNLFCFSVRKQFSIREVIASTSLFSSNNIWNYFYSSRHHSLRGQWLNGECLEKMSK